MKATAFAYIEVFYHRRRRHATRGYIFPVQFLKDWINTLSRERNR